MVISVQKGQGFLLQNQEQGVDQLNIFRKVIQLGCSLAVRSIREYADGDCRHNTM